MSFWHSFKVHEPFKFLLKNRKWNVIFYVPFHDLTFVNAIFFLLTIFLDRQSLMEKREGLNFLFFSFRNSLMWILPLVHYTFLTNHSLNLHFLLFSLLYLSFGSFLWLSLVFNNNSKYIYFSSCNCMLKVQIVEYLEKIQELVDNWQCP